MHGPAGFASSNISKGFLLICGIWSITAIATKKQGLFNLDLDLVGRGQIWRLLTHSFVWSTTSELVIGSICLYNWRLFERQFGTRKFGGCLFFLIVASMILQVVVQLVSRGAVPLLSGPYAVVFGLLANFMFDIPQSAPFTLFGIPLSDKLFVYLLSLQLCLSNIPASCYTAIIGFALGLLYRIECLPFHRLRVPQWLSTGCGRLFSPLLSGSLFATIAGVHDAAGRRVGGGGRVGSGAGAAAAARARQPGGGQPGYEVVNAEPEGEILNDAAAFGGYAAPMQPADVAPDPAAVAQLTGMGFSDERARAALAASGNNVAQATNRLLGQ